MGITTLGMGDVFEAETRRLERDERRESSVYHSPTAMARYLAGAKPRTGLREVVNDYLAATTGINLAAKS